MWSVLQGHYVSYVLCEDEQHRSGDNQQQWIRSECNFMMSIVNNLFCEADVMMKKFPRSRMKKLRPVKGNYVILFVLLVI